MMLDPLKIKSSLPQEKVESYEAQTGIRKGFIKANKQLLGCPATQMFAFKTSYQISWYIAGNRTHTVSEQKTGTSGRVMRSLLSHDRTGVNEGNESQGKYDSYNS